jgi:hypothetical protein
MRFAAGGGEAGAAFPFVKLYFNVVASLVRKISCAAGLMSTSKRFGDTLPPLTCDPRKEALMSIQSHIAELERRHAALEREIEEAIQHPSVDAIQLKELKRRKLHLKDEIAKLHSASTTVH